MIGLLSPAALLIGLAVAVPILLHLLQRQPGPRRVFPALRYLRQAERESARRVKLRQLLLLALRVAALLLLALAAARPFLARGGAEHPPTAVAIVLDNSLSTGLVEGDERVLDRLKSRALATLARANPEDLFWVLRAAEPWDPAVPGGAAEAAERVRGTTGVSSAADLTLAIRRARALLIAGAGDRTVEIHVLSDLQSTGLGGPMPGREEDPAVLVWAPGGEPPPNNGVVAVEVGGGLAPRAGQRATVAAAVAGSADSVDVRLQVGGRVRAAATASPGATALLPLPPQSAGTIEGSVDIDADGLRGDDRRFFVAVVAAPPAVALTAPAPFLEEALDVLAASERIRRVAPARADVRVAPGGVGLEGLGPGVTVVVLPPGSPLELPALNRRLAAAGVPWRYGAAEGAGAARLQPPTDDEELARLVEPARLDRVHPLEAAGGGTGDTVLLALREGTPWLIRGERQGGGRYLLLGSPLTEDATSIAASAAMVPLVDRLVGTWAQTDARAPERIAGEPVPLPGLARAVVRPDGTREEVEGGAPYRGTGVAGVYRVLGDDGELSAFAVNPPPSETPLARVSPGELMDLLPGWTVRVARDAEAWDRMVFRVRRGGEAWWPLALLALVLLVAEMLLSGSGRGGRAGAAAGEPGGAAEEPNMTRAGAWRTGS